VWASNLTPKDLQGKNFGTKLIERELGRAHAPLPSRCANAGVIQSVIWTTLRQCCRTSFIHCYLVSQSILLNHAKAHLRPTAVQGFLLTLHFVIALERTNLIKAPTGYA